jgi:acetyl-CoA carboxylase carboxyltransferase component
MSGDIYQLVYRSTYRSGRIDNTLQALREIVKASSRNNANLRITGYLIFDGETFLQILEGARADIVTTFARIEADPRHRDAVIVQSRMVEKRDFSQWAMGGVLRTTPIPASLSGDEAVELAKAVAEKANAA